MMTRRIICLLAPLALLAGLAVAQAPPAPAPKVVGRPIYDLATQYGPLTPGQDLSPVIEQCLGDIAALTTPANSTGATVRLPAGSYVLSRTLHVYLCVAIEGAGGRGDWQATTLRATHGGSGVVLHAQADAPTVGRADFTSLRSVRLVGPYSLKASPLAWDDPGDGGGHGVEVRAPGVRLTDVDCEGFNADGIHARSTGSQPNCNGFRTDGCLARYNGRHGLFLHGTNTNTGTHLHAQLGQNYGYGVCEIDNFGSAHVGHQAESNRLGGYCFGRPGRNGVGSGSVVECYAERDQPQSNASPPWLVVGGNVDWSGAPAWISTASGVGVRLPVYGPVFRKLKVYARTSGIDPAAYDQLALGAGDRGAVIDASGGPLLAVLTPPAAEMDGYGFDLVRTDGGAATVQVIAGDRSPIHTAAGWGEPTLPPNGTLRLRAVWDAGKSRGRYVAD